MARNDSYHAALSSQAWKHLAEGLREKSLVMDGQIFRILEFSALFHEPDWCLRGHVGFVLEGKLVINVAGEPVAYEKGDVINLREGQRHRHESTVETATLFLIEVAQ